jgi:hypothetical protein
MPGVNPVRHLAGLPPQNQVPGIFRAGIRIDEFDPSRQGLLTATLKNQGNNRTTLALTAWVFGSNSSLAVTATRQPVFSALLFVGFPSA